MRSSPRAAAGAVLMAGLAGFAVAGAMHQDRKLVALRGEPYAAYLRATSLVPFAAAITGRGQVVWRELPWLAFGAGVALAWLLRRVHGAIFDHGGVYVIAAISGGRPRRHGARLAARPLAHAARRRERNGTRHGHARRRNRSRCRDLGRPEPAPGADLRAALPRGAAARARGDRGGAPAEQEQRVAEHPRSRRVASRPPQADPRLAQGPLRGRHRLLPRDAGDLRAALPLDGPPGARRGGRDARGGRRGADAAPRRSVARPRSVRASIASRRSSR